MPNTQKLEKTYKFNHNGTVECTTGSTHSDFKPLFDFIENYTKELGGSTKWVNCGLTVYHKDYGELKREAVDEDVYYEFIEFDDTDFHEEDGDIEVRFGDEIEEGILNVDDIKKMLKGLVTRKLPESFYYTAEEQEVRNAERVIARAKQKEAEEKNRLFEETLKKLRISRAEFLEALKHYNA